MRGLHDGKAGPAAPTKLKLFYTVTSAPQTLTVKVTHTHKSTHFAGL